jgi:hypothetical protein
MTIYGDYYLLETLLWLQDRGVNKSDPTLSAEPDWFVVRFNKIFLLKTLDES